MTTPVGYLCLVLHAHLPFVRHPEYDDFLEEDWLYEAITETYIPLLEVFDGLERDGVDWRMTMSVTPTLAAMLADPLLQYRYLRHLDNLIVLSTKEMERTRWQPEFHPLACMYHERFCRARDVFVRQYNNNLLNGFRRFFETGKLELITCAATHGFLPLMDINANAMRAQIEIGAREFQRHFGKRPQGIWLPECGYSPGVDELLRDSGIRYFFGDTHAVLFAEPRPKFGVYAPILCPKSSVAILGGAAFWMSGPEDGERGLAVAMERGVNHLDIAPQYGEAQRAVGPAIPAVRDRLFVAAKTLRSNPDGVVAQFDETRSFLGCDVLDLYQAHAVTNLDELNDRGPAIERILRLRDEGACRFAGITGHDLSVPRTFLEALDRYDLDTVMFPIYPRLWADPVYREAAEELLALCGARDLGVMVIKAVARRPWADHRPLADAIEGYPETSDRWATSWYEPQREDEAIARGVSFALSTPGVHAFCTPGDLGLLPRVLDAAERFTPMAANERAEAANAMSDEDVIFPIPR